MFNRGILAVPLDVLAEKLGLPDGTRIIGVRMDVFADTGQVEFMLDGDQLPRVELGEKTPNVTLRTTVLHEWKW